MKSRPKIGSIVRVRVGSPHVHDYGSGTVTFFTSLPKIVTVRLHSSDEQRNFNVYWLEYAKSEVAKIFL